MLIGIVGKPSSGKTTLLNALCLTDAKTGSYPFTTIQPNRGVAFVKIDCPCVDLEEDCQPRAGHCDNGTRFVPIEILDVAGLVPGASDGKGMGNQFLDDLRQARAFIHVVDSSGESDEEGNLTKVYDPSKDVIWLNAELTSWISKTLYSDWDKLSRRLDSNRSQIVESILERLSGLGANAGLVRNALRKSDLFDKNPKEWTDDDRTSFADNVRIELFPAVIAANKSDRSASQGNITNLISNFPDDVIIPTSGLAELTLRKAEVSGMIRYLPGSNEIKFIDAKSELSKLGKVIKSIDENLFQNGKTTGVARLLEMCAFNLLNLIIIFPVEDSNHLTDHDGRILPDVFLIPKGTTAKQFAGKIHTDLQNTFINGLLVNENNKRISANHELNNYDIIKIVAAQK